MKGQKFGDINIKDKHHQKQIDRLPRQKKIIWQNKSEILSITTGRHLDSVVDAYQERGWRGGSNPTPCHLNPFIFPKKFNVSTSLLSTGSKDLRLESCAHHHIQGNIKPVLSYSYTIQYTVLSGYYDPKYFSPSIRTLTNFHNESEDTQDNRQSQLHYYTFSKDIVFMQLWRISAQGIQEISQDGIQYLRLKPVNMSNPDSKMTLRTSVQNSTLKKKKI